MRVRMQVGISGGRGDGTTWPPAGGELDVSDEEGAALCRARMAVPVAVPEPPAETPEQPMEAVTEERAADVPPAVAPPPAAPKAAWVDWAVAKGVVRGDAELLTKQQLITQYG